MSKPGNKNPSPDTRFKPGVSGNPNGLKKGTKQVSGRIKLMTIQMVQEIASMILDGDVLGLMELNKESGVPVLKVWLASVAVTAIKNGDMNALNSLLDRICGKVKDHIYLDGEIGFEHRITVPSTIARQAMKEIEEDV